MAEQSKACTEHKHTDGQATGLGDPAGALKISRQEGSPCQSRRAGLTVESLGSVSTGFHKVKL